MRKFISSILTAVMTVSMVVPSQVSAAGEYPHPALRDCMSLMGVIDTTEAVASMTRAEKQATKQACVASYGKKALNIIKNGVLNRTRCEEFYDYAAAETSAYPTVPTRVTLGNACNILFPRLVVVEPTLTVDVDASTPEADNIYLGSHDVHVYSIVMTASEASDINIDTISFNVSGELDAIAHAYLVSDDFESISRVVNPSTGVLQFDSRSEVVIPAGEQRVFELYIDVLNVDIFIGDTVSFAVSGIDAYDMDATIVEADITDGSESEVMTIVLGEIFATLSTGSPSGDRSLGVNERVLEVDFTAVGEHFEITEIVLEYETDYNPINWIRAYSGAVFLGSSTFSSDNEATILVDRFEVRKGLTEKLYFTSDILEGRVGQDDIYIFSVKSFTAVGHSSGMVMKINDPVWGHALRF